MTDLSMLRNHLIHGEGYSELLLAQIKLAIDEISTAREKLLELGGYSPAETAHLLTGCGQSNQHIMKFEQLPGSAALIDLRVTHQDQHSLLAQPISLVCNHGKWIPQITLEDFPELGSPAAVMCVLSDYLIRLGLATRLGSDLRGRLEALWTES